MGARNCLKKSGSLPSSLLCTNKLPWLGPQTEESSSSQSGEYREYPTPRETGKRGHKSSSQRNNRMEASTSSSVGVPATDPDDADPMCPSGIGGDSDTWADRSPRPNTSRERGNPRSSRERMMVRAGHV